MPHVRCAQGSFSSTSVKLAALSNQSTVHAPRPIAKAFKAHGLMIMRRKWNLGIGGLEIKFAPSEEPARTNLKEGLKGDVPGNRSQE